MKKRLLSILLCLCMVCTLLPETAGAAETIEAQWIFGANNIAPSYETAESGTLADAFEAANDNSADTVCYVQLKTGGTASSAFTLNGKSMVLDLNGNTITVTSSTDDIKGIINDGGNLTVQKGIITVKHIGNSTYCSAYGIINNNGTLRLNDCTISASAVGSGGQAGGINAYGGGGTVITDCSVTASSTQSMAFGIETQSTVIIHSSSFKASSDSSTADTYAIRSIGSTTVMQMLGENTYGYYINNILQNDLGAAKTVGASGETVEVKEIVHEHSWTYTESGDTITAACEGPGVCESTVNTTLTIGAPALTTYGGSGNRSATLGGEFPQIYYIGDVVTGVNAITYQKKLANGGWEDLAGAPTTPGTYKASITADTATASVEYTIAKAANSLTLDPAPKSLTYTGDAQALVTAGTANGGTVQYKLGSDGTYGTAIPTATNAGTYTVYYKVVGGDNYNDVAENSVEVTISKVDPTAPTGLTGTQNNALSTVTLPDGWTWVDGTATMSTLGDQPFQANYAGSNNYNVASNVTVTVTVSDKTNVSDSITFADGERTYNGAGQDYEAATITGASGGSWTYTYIAGDGTASLVDGKPLTVGTYTVTATYEDSTRFGTKTATLTIKKATPTGTPTYTAITAADKTLADAALGVGSITPAGAIQWVDESDAPLDAATVVTANTAYKWRFTPDDTTNYNTLTGSITPYVVSYSGGGGGSYTPPTYKVESEVTKETDGGVSFSTGSAQKGDTVTITVTPDTYYQVEEVIVKDSSGKIIEVTENKDGTFSFQMPASEVTVEPVFFWDNPFADVREEAYYTPAVEWALKNNITNGTGDGTTFSPAASCTRAQMATFLWRAAGSPEPMGSSNPFADVSGGNYYAKAVQWAYEQGITGGTSANAFSPDAACTRAQMVTFLHRVADTQKPEDGSNPFADVPADQYYAEAVQWAYEQGITGGTNATTFSPNNICTRAQMVTFLHRYFGN